jgi:hypothetical protein
MLLLISTLLILGGPPNTTVFYAPNGDIHVVGDSGVNDILMDSNGTPFIWVGFGQTLNGVPGPTAFVVEQEPVRLFVSLGDGDDVLFLMEPLATDRVFDLGAGDDFLDIGNVASGSTVIDAGPGDDHVHTEDCSYFALEVYLGSGADSFELAFSFLYGSLAIHAGDGDDLVRLRHSFVRGSVWAFGGSGVDAFINTRSDLLEPPKIVEFESIRPGGVSQPARPGGS